MLRIIDGVALIGQESADRWAVAVHELGNGHIECSIRKCIDWRQAEWDPAKARADLLDRIGADALAKRDAEDAEAARLANLERAARRAKTRVRRLCKVQGLDTLLTLTYRACMADLAACKRHLDLFCKRMRRALGSFAYVAAFERQKRGAWHVHLAVHRLPAVLDARNGVKVKSFNVVRAMWRDVVGDLGGNVDVSRRKRTAHKSASKVAGYLSKYMLKAFGEGEAGSNRYSASMGVRVPPATVVELRAASLLELVELVFVDLGRPGMQLSGAWVSPFGDGAYLSAELSG